MGAIYYVFGLFMILFYLGMAYIMIFSPIFAERVSDPLRYGMGALFFLYGIFRAYRLVKGIYVGTESFARIRFHAVDRSGLFFVQG